MEAPTAEPKFPARRVKNVTPEGAEAWSRNIAKGRAKGLEIRCANANAFQASIEPAVVERYQMGMGCARVANSLNEAGYRTARGKLFKPFTVYKILERAGVLRRDEVDDL